MKNNVILLMAILFSGFASAQVGINTPKPETTLQIDAKSPTGTSNTVDGLLIPRVDRQKAQSMTGIPVSTLIYIDKLIPGTQTGITANVDELGFYYFDGTVWVKLRDPNNLDSIVTDWKIAGNAATDPKTNFIGTTDNKGLAIRTDNKIRALIDSTGILRVGDMTNASVNQSAVSIATANNAAANAGVLSVLDSRFSTALSENPPSADIFNGRGSPASDLLAIGHNSNSNAPNYTPRSIAFYNVNPIAGGRIGQIGWVATPGKVTRLSQTAASISDFNSDRTNNYSGLNFSTRGTSGFGSRMVINSIGYVGIGTIKPTSLLDLGVSLGSNANDVAGKKLAVYNNDNGTDFYGMGISGGLLQFHAASTTDEAPGMVLTGGGKVGIGTTSPAASAALEVSSTSAGFLPPRMTTAQRNAIASKVAGLVIYNTETNCLEFWNSASWVSTCAAGAGTATINCNSASLNGILKNDTVTPPNVTVTVSYTNGNGGAYSTQTIPSTGILGLTATLNGANFNVGAGELIFTITGTPKGEGVVSFPINFGGTNCPVKVTVNELLEGEVSCPTGPDGEYPYPNVPTKYIKCITIGGVKRSYPYKCPAGTTFNPNTNKCVL